MMALLLLDLAPAPAGIGIVELIVLLAVVLVFSALLIGAFVCVLIWRRRRRKTAPGSPVVTS